LLAIGLTFLQASRAPSGDEREQSTERVFGLIVGLGGLLGVVRGLVNIAGAVNPRIAVKRERDAILTQAHLKGFKAGQQRVEALKGDVPSLVVALNDEDKDVRWSAAFALGDTGDARAVEPLVAALADDALVLVAARALGKIGDPRAVDPLAVVLMEDGNPVRQREAAEALGRIGDPRAVDPLIAALGAEAQNVQAAAALALGKIRDPRAVDPLITALGAKAEGLRSTAADALGDIGDARAVGPLTATVEDPGSGIAVKFSARQALEKLTGSQSGSDLSP
jgi:hypothetical protein